MATPTNVATRAGVNAFFDLQTASSVEKATGALRLEALMLDGQSRRAS